MEPQEVPQIVFRDKWCPKTGGPYWRIASITENSVGLTGPASCRSYKVITIKMLLDNWVKVPEGDH